MAAPRQSEAVTDSIRVVAEPRYLPEHSNPERDNYVFGYRIQIDNESDHAVTLLRRRWMIIDADGRPREVTGNGVVGENPRIEAGESFSYKSFAVIGTPWGTMEGCYRMQRDDLEEFDVEVNRFYLTMPAPVATLA